MAKAVILKTPKGIMLMGAIQCSNGSWFDAEGCYRYCKEKTEERENHQAFKLMASSTLLAHYPKTKEKWYKDRGNFIDIEIPYDVDQTFMYID